jgi:hypothetical protein
MVMMVVPMGQRSHYEKDIRAAEIWLSIGLWDKQGLEISRAFQEPLVATH